MASTNPSERRDDEGRAGPVDAHVGSRIRLRRTMRGLSQEKLADALGLTFQQVQKYERGLNRVGASRLFHLSQILDVPISFFFDDMPELLLEPQSSAHRRGTGFAPVQENLSNDVLNRRETLELVRAYYKITDPGVRKRVSDLIRSLISDEPEKA